MGKQTLRGKKQCETSLAETQGGNGSQCERPEHAQPEEASNEASMPARRSQVSNGLLRASETAGTPRAVEGDLRRLGVTDCPNGFASHLVGFCHRCCVRLEAKDVVLLTKR